MWPLFQTESSSGAVHDSRSGIIVSSFYCEAGNFELTLFIVRNNLSSTERSQTEVLLLYQAKDSIWTQLRNNLIK